MKQPEEAATGLKTLNLRNFYVEKRSLFHLVRFVEGFSAGWRFCLPEHFKDALDIKKLPRIGTTEDRDDGEGDDAGSDPIDDGFTQGRLFSFATGDMIYDCKEAYTLCFGEALRHIRYAVQVTNATPSRQILVEHYQTRDAVEVLKNGEPIKTIFQLDYRKSKIAHGAVSFKLYKTKSDCSGLEEVGSYQTDQEKFALFLHTGIIRNFTGKIVSNECA